MLGYISTIKDFKNTPNESIICLLKKINKGCETSQMDLYKQLQDKPNAPVYNKSIEEMQKDSGDYDPEIEMLEKMLAERKARKKLDFDM